MICVNRRSKGVAPQRSVSMAGIPIPQVKTLEHLGVIFNDTLTWRCTKGAPKESGMEVEKNISLPRTHRIYAGTVLPTMKYAWPVWERKTSSEADSPSRIVFAGVIRQVCLLSRRSLTSTLWYFFTKCGKPDSFIYLSSLMPLPSSTSGYQFRREPYPVPAVSKISSLSTSFITRSIILWNTLTSIVQSAKTASQFKSLLKSHMHV